MNRIMKNVGIVLALLMVVCALEMQPWLFVIKPIARTQKALLVSEANKLQSELRTLRQIAKTRNGGSLPDFDEAAKKDPLLADYKRRFDDSWNRRMEFQKKHPNFGGW